MIDHPTDAVLSRMFEWHRKRFPADEHVRIHVVQPQPWTIADDCVRIQVDRIKGLGRDCQYRHAVADVPLDGYYRRYDKDALVNAFAEAIDDLVRILLRPMLPAFRIRRDARRLTHKRDAPTRRFSSRLSRPA